MNESYGKKNSCALKASNQIKEEEENHVKVELCVSVVSVTE